MAIALCKQKPDSKYLHDLVMQDLQQPVVFHGVIQEWPAIGWTPEDLASVLGDKEVKIRIGLKEAKQWESTQWEASCSYETTMLTHYCDWLRQDRHPDTSLDTPQDRQGDNPLMRYDQDTHWCYVDYKYMAELFEEHPDILKAIRWSDFGFSGRDGHQSTIWIGSQGATTPGHYDTYGCNLVAQLYGRKKWHLFPPSQSDALYQTRIPYEESSVFSPVNIAKPDLKKFPQFSTATPNIVTLDPGDVLFVPRHWWHFVETIETAISVNTWIEMETDHRDRFQESITRALVSGMLSSSDDSRNSKWLNPTEELCDTATNMEYLKMAATNFVQHQKQTDIKTDDQSQQASDGMPIKPQSHCSDDKVLQSSSHRAEISFVADQPPMKKSKQMPESQKSTTSDNLPHFVALVPCLGQIYNKRETFCNDKDPLCHDKTAQQSCNSDMPPKCMTDMKCQNKESVENQERKSSNSHDEAHQVDGAGDSEKEDVFEIFLQSVTHPEVINHIADLFCKKIKEEMKL